MEQAKPAAPGEGLRPVAAAPAAKPAKVQIQPSTLKALAREEEREEKEEAERRRKEKRPSLRKGEIKEKKPLKLVVTEELEEEEEVEAPPRPVAPAPRREGKRKKAQPQAPQRVVREVQIPDEITVRELAERMAVRAGEVVKTLMKLGVMANINQTIDADTAELVVTELGHIPRRVSEAVVEEGLEGPPDRPEDLVPRPPVVTVMGHVDHGKTSLLDALRHTDVAAREAGGITQHIGAYRVDIGRGLPVTFIDTPGHEAFTQMRARGARVTDIVVLVVAADDGVMPQTVEAIRHARAAGVPIVVAINKIDKPEADPARVKQELLNHEVVVEEFGGDVQCVEVSAVKRIGLEELIEAIQLQAELLELEANPNRRAVGTILEAKLDRGRGPVATVLVQNGTLHVGDVVVAGAHWERVRAMMDDRGQRVEEAGPATPVEILGLDGVPEPGDRLVAVEDEEKAREVAEYRRRRRQEEEQKRRAAAAPVSSLEELLAKMRAGEVAELPIVLKADVHGSLEAIRAGIEKMGGEEVRPRIVHAGVGAISESDVHLAKASGAVVIGFNVRAPAAVRELAKREGVDIRYYAVIYELLDDVKKMLEAKLAPEEREQVLGHAEVRQVFGVPKVGRVAGCMVTDGVVRRGARVRVVRDGVVVYDGVIGSLRRFKEDVREVREGYECGIGIEGFQDIREGDVLEVYEVQEVARTLAV
ncbi:Translation initiation factor IF-2 [bacterium HR39]|nr:Translation initiation factor IF-2 [bacterium HR39]